MSEVDYSQFYYRRESEKEIKTPPPEKRKPKRSKRPLLVFFVLILLFGIVLFAADVFTDGYLLTSVKDALSKNDYEFYFVVTQVSGREMAHAKSLLVRQGGGSGYIMTGKEGYYVVYSVYFERSEAETVASKNTGTFVYAQGFSSDEREFYNTLSVCMETVMASSDALEKGTASESEFYGTVTEAKNSLISVKEKALKENRTVEVNLAEYFIAGINNLQTGKETRLSLLSDVRYLISGVASSACMANE